MIPGLKKKPDATRPVVRDPLAVVPILSSNVEMKRDSQGLIHLRQTPAVNKIRKKLADVFGFDYSRKIALDEYGTLYCSLVDGKRTLREIIQGMIPKLGGEREQVEESVILFTKKLMAIRMIVLEVTPESQKGKAP
jgi:hypothetical protein